MFVRLNCLAINRQNTTQGIKDVNAKTIPTTPKDEGTDIKTAEINPQIPIVLCAGFASKNAIL